MSWTRSHGIDRRAVPHVLAGDFNANSPTQRIDPDQCKPATKKAWHDNGGRIPRRVIERLLAAGYVDTLRQTHRESADEMTSFTTHWPGQRVDYIFSFGMALQGAWIRTRSARDVRRAIIIRSAANLCCLRQWGPSRELA